MKLQISKSIFIVEIEENYNVDHHFAVYAKETEPFPHNSFCWSYKCYEDAIEYAVEQAIELNESINDKQINNYETISK